MEVGELETLLIDKPHHTEIISSNTKFDTTTVENRKSIGMICRNCFNCNTSIFTNTMKIYNHNDTSTSILPNNIDDISIVATCAKCNTTSDKIITDSNFMIAIKTFIKKQYTIIDISRSISIIKPYKIWFKDNSIAKYIDTLPITWSYNPIDNSLELDYSNYNEGILDINYWVKILKNNITNNKV